jgi:hypothetical protein
MQVASKAHLWTRCALSGSLIAGRAEGYISPHDPDADKDQSDARREGTAAHWLIGEIFAERLRPDDNPTGITAPNGWVVDAEMVEHARAYVDYVRGFGGSMYGGSEMPINIGHSITGRLDNAVMSQHERVIRVFDFKYGWRIVEAVENPELLCYGVALAPPGFSLELHIYQPRPFHPDGIARAWNVDADDVDRWCEWLIGRARLANGDYGVPHATPGEHCRDCPGRGSCQALAVNVYAQHEVITDTRLAKMDAKQLAAELDFLELAEACLKQRKAGVEAEAEGRIASGEFVKGWELQPRTGHRKFTVPMTQVHMMTGISPYKQTEMTPAELERAGAKKDIVKQIVHTPVIGRKLERATTTSFDRMFKK